MWLFYSSLKKVLSLSDEMHVNYWTGCEQKTTDKGALLPINNMTCAIIRSQTCDNISLMFLAHVSLPQASCPTTSVISFDPPATWLFWLAPAFSQDIPGDRVSHSSSFGIYKLLCPDFLVPLSHRSHPWRSATGRSPCLWLALPCAGTTAPL